MISDYEKEEQLQIAQAKKMVNERKEAVKIANALGHCIRTMTDISDRSLNCNFNDVSYRIDNGLKDLESAYKLAKAYVDSI